MNRRIHIPHDFKASGLNDWVPIFRAGKQTDSKGRTQEWTEADLDQVVANHSADHPAPHVITHKELYSPFAYARTAELKREGDLLLAKSKDVDPQFAKLLKDGRLYERSVRFVKTGKGWKLGHIAWLGAEPPAVEGLAPVQFSAEPEACDFSIASNSQNMLAGMMRRMREFLIAKFSQEDADRVMPNWELDHLQENAGRMEKEEEERLERGLLNPSFAAPGGTTENPTGGTVSFTQADIDAAKAKAREEVQAEFAAKEKTLAEQLATERRGKRETEFKAFHADLVAAGHAPAALEGMTEFMHSLADADAAEFEFSAADGTKQKKHRLDWFRDFAKGRKPEVEMGELGGGKSTVDLNDPNAIAAAAREFCAAEEKAGRTVSIVDAVAHVTQGVK